MWAAGMVCNDRNFISLAGGGRGGREGEGKEGGEEEKEGKERVGIMSHIIRLVRHTRDQISATWVSIGKCCIRLLS